jgi:hypothetical protein
MACSVRRRVYLILHKSRSSYQRTLRGCLDLGIPLIAEIAPGLVNMSLIPLWPTPIFLRSLIAGSS